MSVQNSQFPDLKSLQKQLPLLEPMIQLDEVFWINPKLKERPDYPISEDEIYDAINRLKRFAPYIQKSFPETIEAGGLIESELKFIPQMKAAMEGLFDTTIDGQLMIKLDSHLPIAGSIKARGGIYEVLKHAEDLAMDHGMLTLEDDYSVFASKAFRDFFSHYSIAVGSTGNLGLSIGIISAQLGFQVYVHMSADAKAWKKKLLKSKGVHVIEYDDDYSVAVEKGREESMNDPKSYFIDDENSKNLFLGYTVAAYRLKDQLDAMGVTVDRQHPLWVYLPCGVGGGPGGIAYGLKMIFGDDVHCFFAEPTHSPCMLLGMMTGQHDLISVQDIGIDNKTEADGLAVGRASGLVGKLMDPLLSGVFTVDDAKLFPVVASLIDSEQVAIEPSAAAGFQGPIRLSSTAEGQHYLDVHGLKDSIQSSHHIVWATGGSFVPEDIMEDYYNRGQRYIEEKERQK